VTPPHFLTPLLDQAGGTPVLRNARTGEPVARRLELAGDSKTRRRGLLGRPGLDPDSALILAPCNGIHTFFMRFRIDVAFVGRTGRVLKVVPGLRPWRIALSTGAFATVELAEGVILRTDLRVGDQLICD
jgi:hypothetical protein